MGAVEQASNVTPPRRGSIVAIAVDGTARPYDISALTIAGYTPSSPRESYVYLTLQADGGDIYVQFADDTHADLANGTVIAAGGTLAYANAHAAKIASGDKLEVRIDRHVDKWIILQSSATATLRMWGSSGAF